MSVVSTLKTQVDLPVWEWCRFAVSASVTASSSCTAKNGLFNPLHSRYIYYQYTNTWNRYDTWTDSWEILSPFVTAMSVFSSCQFMEEYGHEGRVLAASSTSFTGPGLSGKALVGYDVVIVSGTGVGQRRVITAVSEPTAAITGVITAVTNTAASYTTACSITDSTQAWAINAYAGYQCRITFGPGVGQVRKILYNSATVLTFSDTAKMGEDFLSVPANFNPTLTASSTQYAIESSVFTVDTAWTTTPDATSRFRIQSGVITLVSGAAATPFWTMQMYDVASDIWYQRTAQTLLASGTTATDGAVEHTGENAAVWTRGQSTTSGSVTTLTDSSQNWAVNQWVGYTVYIFSGTGKNQISLISANTATQLTFATITTAPDATSFYMIHGYSSGTSSGSNTATTLNDTTQAWTANQWTNYQCRILAGTGIGQVLPIVSNTSTALTLAARSIVNGTAGGWSTTPDSTSIYVIQPNTDRSYITLPPNNSIVVYNHDDDLAASGQLSDSGTNRNGSVQYGTWKPIAISTLTSVTTTATCTTVNNHNLQTGYTVTIKGETTNPTSYNISASITVTGATTFTYTIVSVAGAAGTFSTPSGTTLVDASKNWTSNQWANAMCYFTVTGGAAPTGFACSITSNTATVLTFSQTVTTPVNGTTRYVICPTLGIVGGNQTVEYGLVTSGASATTLTDSTKTWVTNQWVGRHVKLTGFTGQGTAEGLISANTSTGLTFSTTTTACVAGTSYAILENTVLSTGIDLDWGYGVGGPWSGNIGGGTTYTPNYEQQLTPVSNLYWGRYLLMARGGATVGFNRLDLTTGQWVNLYTAPVTETLTTGSQFSYDGGNRLYFTPQVTGRVYYLDIFTNHVHGAGTVPYTAGTALIAKVMQVFFTPDQMRYLWLNRQSNTETFRLLLFW